MSVISPTQHQCPADRGGKVEAGTRLVENTRPSTDLSLLTGRSALNASHPVGNARRCRSFASEKPNRRTPLSASSRRAGATAPRRWPARLVEGQVRSSLGACQSFQPRQTRFDERRIKSGTLSCSPPFLRISGTRLTKRSWSPCPTWATRSSDALPQHLHRRTFVLAQYVASGCTHHRRHPGFRGARVVVGPPQPRTGTDRHRQRALVRLWEDLAARRVT